MCVCVCVNWNHPCECSDTVRIKTWIHGTALPYDIHTHTSISCTLNVHSMLVCTHNSFDTAVQTTHNYLWWFLMWGGMIRLMWLVETSYWTCLTWWFLNGFNVIVWNLLLLDTRLTWCFFGGVNYYIPRLLVDWWSWSLRIHWCVCIFVKFITTSTSSHLPVSHYFSTSRLTGRKTPTYLLTYLSTCRLKGKMKHTI